MALKTSEKAVYQALGFDGPDIPDSGLIEVGTIRPADTEATISAVVDHWLKGVRPALQASEYFSDDEQEALTHLDCLTFPEYLRTVRKIDTLRNQKERERLNIKNKSLALHERIEKWGDSTEEKLKKIKHRESKLEADIRKHEQDLDWLREYGKKVGSQIVNKQHALKKARWDLKEIQRQKNALIHRTENRHQKSQAEIDFLNTIDCPPLEVKVERFLSFYSPNLHTSDRIGYLNYLQRAMPLLAKKMQKQLPAYLPQKECREHTYITGRSGCGKSELLKAIIFAYVCNPESDSVVIIDPGDMAEQVAMWPETAQSGRLVYIDPQLSEQHTPIINPFETRAESENGIQAVAEQVASVFQELIRRSGYHDLTGNMNVLLNACIPVLLRIESSTLKDLQDFMNDKINARLV